MSDPWLDPYYIRSAVCLITCLGIGLSSLEWLVPISKLKSTGLIAFRTQSTIRLRWWQPYGLWLLFAARLLCAAWCIPTLIITPHHSLVGIGILLCATLSLIVRLPRPIGVLVGMDGAEHMMTVTLLVMGPTYLLHSQTGLDAALLFLAFVVLMEYSAAGWMKLRQWRGWSRGEYLAQVLASRNYGHPALNGWLRHHIWIQRALSISVVMLEIVAPFSVILPPPFAEILLVMILAFHVSTAYVMGLNTFVWAFSATYPAVIYLRNQILFR